MGVINDVKALIGDVKNYFSKTGAAKKEAYAGYEEAKGKMNSDAKQVLSDEWAAGKDVVSAYSDERKAAKEAKKAEKQFGKDYKTYVKDQQKVEDLRKQLAQAEAELKTQEETTSTSAQKMVEALVSYGGAAAGTDAALQAAQEVAQKGQETMTADKEAAKTAKATGDATYSEKKQVISGEFHDAAGKDLKQLGHDTVVDAKVGGLQTAKVAVIASEVAAGITIASTAPLALPGACVVGIYGTREFMKDMNKKIAEIKAAEQKPEDPGSEQKAA